MTAQKQEEDQLSTRDEGRSQSLAAEELGGSLEGQHVPKLLFPALSVCQLIGFDAM